MSAIKLPWLWRGGMTGELVLFEARMSKASGCVGKEGIPTLPFS
jgi:hypothetical protein